MVNGGRVVELDESLAACLSAAAASAGKPALDCAAFLISDGLDDDWVEDDRRFAEYERTGVSFDAKDALLEMRALLVAEFQAKG